MSQIKDTQIRYDLGAVMSRSLVTAKIMLISVLILL